MVTAEPLVDRATVDDPAPRLFEPGGPTLEDVVVEAWEELTVSGRAACPVCGGEMTPTRGCKGCGAELS